VASVETNPRLAAALLYAALRWYVLPLHTPDAFGACDCPKRGDCPKPGKHPRTQHGLDDASIDQDRVSRWWSQWPQANIGVDLARSGLVDIAPDSLEWFAEFTARGLPPTLSFVSGGGDGHAHHLYARPEGCAIYRDTHTGEYDVMSAGYAVMPPSLHASQRVYTFTPMPGGELLAPPSELAPAWVVELLNRKGQHRAAADASPREGDDSPPVDLRGEALERWHGRLYESKPQGGVDRSYSLWWLAVVLLEAGCRPRFVEQLLAERDVALGWTKFAGRRDVLHRYRVIVSAAAVSRGPGPVRLRTAKDQRQVAAEVLEWLTAMGVEAMESEEVRWLAHGLVGAGLLTELDGKAKLAGKTTLVLDLVHAIVHGEEFLGQKTAYAPVLYLTEQSGPSFKRNLSRAGLLDRSDVHILFWNRVAGHRWEAVIDAVRRKAKEVNAGLLIVDTLAQWSGVRGDDENKSGSAMQTMEPLQVATQDGLAVIASRHDRKSGGEVGDSGRGSSAFVGAVDIVLHLQRLPSSEGKERQRLLEGVSRFEETPDKLLIEYLPGEEGERSTFRAIGDQAEVRRRLLSTEILATLSNDPDLAMSEKDLRELLGVSANDLRHELWELMKAHAVARVGEGHRGSAYRYYQRPEVGDDLP
jgi:hypothetical protein